MLNYLAQLARKKINKIWKKRKTMAFCLRRRKSSLPRSNHSRKIRTTS